MERVHVTWDFPAGHQADKTLLQEGVSYEIMQSHCGLQARSHQTMHDKKAYPTVDLLQFFDSMFG